MIAAAFFFGSKQFQFLSSVFDGLLSRAAAGVSEREGRASALR
jgi:hypothetical protein